MIFMGVTFSLLSGFAIASESVAQIACSTDRDDPLHTDDLEIRKFIPRENFVLVEKNSLQRKSHLGASPITTRSHDVDRRNAFEVRALFGAL